MKYENILNSPILKYENMKVWNKYEIWKYSQLAHSEVWKYEMNEINMKYENILNSPFLKYENMKIWNKYEIWKYSQLAHSEVWKYRRFNAIVSQLWFWPFWVMFFKLWLKSYTHRPKAKYELTSRWQYWSYKYDVFNKKKLASNVQSSCIDNSKWPKSELWHYCIKATICRRKEGQWWLALERLPETPMLSL